MGRPTLFISYSHADAEWAARVATHLAPLGELLTTWDDRRIGAGSQWRADIERALDGASVAVLLISAHFLSSRFIREVEVPRLLQRQAGEGLHLVPDPAHPMRLGGRGLARTASSSAPRAGAPSRSAPSPSATRPWPRLPGSSACS